MGIMDVDKSKVTYQQRKTIKTTVKAIPIIWHYYLGYDIQNKLPLLEYIWKLILYYPLTLIKTWP